jgi:molybdate transport system substrate-binding protein
MYNDCGRIDSDCARGMRVATLPRRSVLVGLLAAVLATAIIAPTGRGQSADLMISAAASLKDVLDEIASVYKSVQPSVAVRFNLGASGTLQQQIEQGAPVDIFLSAAPAQMDALAAKGLLLEGTRRDLVRNSIVLIAPTAGDVVSNFQDLTKPQVKFIAVGEPQTVPAGAYAKEVLTHLGLYDQLQTKFVLSRDVRQVLTYVATGNADAGIVYSTDAKTTPQVKVVSVAPENTHSPVIYPVAVLKGSQYSAAARAFSDFLFSLKAQEIFTKYGFAPAKP